MRLAYKTVTDHTGADYIGEDVDFIDEITRGAEALDAVAPGWADQIELKSLDLDNVHHCVLGQLAVSDLLSTAVTEELEEVSGFASPYRRLGHALRLAGAVPVPFEGVPESTIMAYYGFNVVDLTVLSDVLVRDAFGITEEQAAQYRDYVSGNVVHADGFDTLTDQWKDFIAARKGVERRPAPIGANLIDNLPTQPRSLV